MRFVSLICIASIALTGCFDEGASAEPEVQREDVTAPEPTPDNIPDYETISGTYDDLLEVYNSVPKPDKATRDKIAFYISGYNRNISKCEMDITYSCKISLDILLNMIEIAAELAAKDLRTKHADIKKRTIDTIYSVNINRETIDYAISSANSLSVEIDEQIQRCNIGSLNACLGAYYDIERYTMFNDEFNHVMRSS